MRMILGSLVLMHYLHVTDEQTVPMSHSGMAEHNKHNKMNYGVNV